MKSLGYELDLRCAIIGESTRCVLNPCCAHWKRSASKHNDGFFAECVFVLTEVGTPTTPHLCRTSAKREAPCQRWRIPDGSTQWIHMFDLLHNIAKHLNHNQLSGVIWTSTTTAWELAEFAWLRPSAATEKPWLTASSSVTRWLHLA